VKYFLFLILMAGGVSILWTRVGSAGEAKPIKEAAIKVLAAFASALEAKDVEKAWKYLLIPPKFKDQEQKYKEEFTKKLAKILEAEISTKGVEVLAKKGKWGKLPEIVGEKEAKRLADLFQLPPSSFFGLFVTARSGAAFYLDGKEWRLIYFNNIATLARE